MRFMKIGKTVAAVMVLIGLGSAVVLAQPPAANNGKATLKSDQAPPTPKGKLPVMPNLPAFEQLQRVQFPTQYQNGEDTDLSKPQILCNTFIRLLAEKHFTLTAYQDQQNFLQKWLPKIKDVTTLEEADKLNIAAMESLGQRFDYYMSPDEKASEEATSDPSIVGIGISVRLKDQESLLDPLPDDAPDKDIEKALTIDDKHPLYLTPYPGSPAAKAGVWDGDVLVEVDGTPVKGMTLKELVSKIRGKKGTKVKFKIERNVAPMDLLKTAQKVGQVLSPELFGKPSEFEVPKNPAEGTPTTREFEIERDSFVPPVVHVRQLEDGSTLIKLDNFMANNAAAEMLKALREVAAKSNGKVILDLRNNGGGRLDHAINIVQYMLGEGTIVRLRQRDGSQMLAIHHTAARDALITTQQTSWNAAQINYSASQRILGIPETVPIVVLINRWTASASELTSGALQFHKRAKIVGDNSIGKGVGQQVIDLPEGRRTHITTFYFDPAARIIDFEGIHPDVKRSLEPEQKQIKDLRAKLRGLVKDSGSNKTKLDDAIAKGTKAETDLPKVETDLVKAKTDLENAKTDAEKAAAKLNHDELTTLRATLVKEKETQAKEKERLTKELADQAASISKTGRELQNLHDLLRTNDPQLQEAQKTVKQEFERIQAEEKAKKEQREKTVEEKRKNWEEQKKLRDQMREKQKSDKKAAA
jgi:C-terminal processing protease CtpA/Prc